MESIKYATLVSDLFRRIPEFGEFEPTPYRDLPYDVFGSFASYMCEILRDGRESLVKRSCEFLNDMAMSSDSAVVNLLVVAVFEGIGDDAECLDALRRRLCDTAAALLDRTIAGWKTDA